MATKRSYSAKSARAGKDIGKPGKNFSKIEAKAGKKYGSKAAGMPRRGSRARRVAGKKEMTLSVDHLSEKALKAAGEYT